MDQIANNSKYYKSIMYKIHLSDAAEKIQRIQLLSNTNLYLAAQTILTSEKNELLENEIADKAFEFTGNLFQKINCLKTLISLNKSEYLLNLVNSFSGDKKITLKILTEFSGIEFKEIIRSIILSDINEEYKKSYLKRIIKWSIKRGIAYEWNEKDDDLISLLLSKYIEHGNISIIKFFLGLDIPKKFITEDCIDIAYNRIEKKNQPDCIYFIKKYDDINNIAKSFFEYLERYDAKKTKLFLDILYERNFQFFGNFYTENDFFKAYIFCMFDVNLQYELALKYGIFYYFKSFFYDIDGKISKDFRPLIYGLTNECLKLLQMDFKDLSCYSKEFLLDKQSFLKKYHIESKEKFNSFLIQKSLSKLPILIYDNMIAKIEELKHEYNLTGGLVEYMNECTNKPLFVDENEYYIRLAGTPYMVRCVKNKVNYIKKYWYAQKIADYDIKIITRKLQNKNQTLIFRCNEISSSTEILELFNIFLELKTPDLYYLANKNINLINLFLFCRLRYNDQYIIARDFNIYVKPIVKITFQKELKTDDSKNILLEFIKNPNIRQSFIESKSLYSDYFYIDINPQKESEFQERINYVRYTQNLRKNITEK